MHQDITTATTFEDFFAALPDEVQKSWSVHLIKPFFNHVFVFLLALDSKEQLGDEWYGALKTLIDIMSRKEIDEPVYKGQNLLFHYLDRPVLDIKIFRMIVEAMSPEAIYQFVEIGGKKTCAFLKGLERRLSSQVLKLLMPRKFTDIVMILRIMATERFSYSGHQMREIKRMLWSACFSLKVRFSVLWYRYDPYQTVLKNAEKSLGNFFVVFEEEKGVLVYKRMQLESPIFATGRLSSGHLEKSQIAEDMVHRVMQAVIV